VTPELEGWRFSLEESLHVDVPRGALSAGGSLAADLWAEVRVRCACAVCVCACAVCVCGVRVRVVCACACRTGGLKVAIDESDAAAVRASAKQQGVIKTLLLDKARQRVELLLFKDNWNATLLLVERPIPARGRGSFPQACVVCRVSCVVCRVSCVVCRVTLRLWAGGSIDSVPCDETNGLLDGRCGKPHSSGTPPTVHHPLLL
jgi:hypothetical protein